jgi:putative Mg2+ transporter-C (MgtC) family protein
MHDWFRYFGDLHQVLPEHWAGVCLVTVSIICGLMVGAEREAKQKAAGIRTVTLICVGSTIFTLASILLADDHDDRTRIAAQVVTGVGFLGAGAIIRHRGTIIGLTTGATIWTVAAVGVLVGGGYAAAGLVLTVVIVLMLVVVGRIERQVLEPCRLTDLEIVYQPDAGKTRVRLLHILDEYRVPDHRWDVAPHGENEVMKVRYCHYHHSHRSLLFEIVEVPGVVEMHRERSPRESK